MSTLLISKDREAVLAEVRAEMARQRVTQRTLAKATDSPEASVSRWLAGKQDVRLGDLLDICGALNVSLAVIAERAEARSERVA